MKILIATTSCDTLAEGHRTGLWLEEFAVPFYKFLASGASIVVASPNGGMVPLDPKTKPTEEQKVEWAEALKALQQTKRLSEVNVDGIDGIFIPGGHGPMIDLVFNQHLIKLIEDLDRKSGIIAAVCHGPVALLNARNRSNEPFVTGRKVTGFSNLEEAFVLLHQVVPFLLEDELKAKGGKYESSLIPMVAHVVRDGNLITGQNPSSSRKLADEMIAALRNNPVKASR
jgi:putative intracellular protease/amidase